MATFKSQPNSISYSKDNKWTHRRLSILIQKSLRLLLCFFSPSKNRLLTYYAVITIVQFEDCLSLFYMQNRFCRHWISQGTLKISMSWSYWRDSASWWRRSIILGVNYVLYGITVSRGRFGPKKTKYQFRRRYDVASVFLFIN